MALAKVVNYSKFLLLLGNGATPQAFAAPCGLTSRGINFSAETNDSNIPDCDNEDAPSWLGRDVVSLSGEISGSGVLDLDALEVWQDFFGKRKTVRVMVDVPLAQSGGYWQGGFLLTGFNVTGERGSKVNVEVTLTSDGEVPWVPAAA